jgi:hypothetical protein
VSEEVNFGAEGIDDRSDILEFALVRFTVTWIDIFQIEDGKLAEAWLEIDTADFGRQLQVRSE